MSESIVGFKVAATRQKGDRSLNVWSLATGPPAAKLRFPAGRLFVNVIVAFGNDIDDSASHDVCAVTLAIGIKASAASVTASNAGRTIFMTLLDLENSFLG